MDRLENEICYRSASEVAKQPSMANCVLDLLWPNGAKNFNTVVWFHGGGLTCGDKEILEGLKNSGLAVLGVRYRLSPSVSCEDCLDDAAAAIAWAFNNIERYGGSKDRIFISGHSAGGYITAMVGLDKSWLAKYGVDADKIAGIAPLSGHAITHFTVRELRGIPATRPIIDTMAPLYHVRPEAPPVLLVTGDRELEMLGRYEENAYFMRMLKLCGHKDVTLYEIQAHGHGEMLQPALLPLKLFIARIRPA